MKQFTFIIALLVAIGAAFGQCPASNAVVLQDHLNQFHVDAPLVQKCFVTSGTETIDFVMIFAQTAQEWTSHDVTIVNDEIDNSILITVMDAGCVHVLKQIWHVAPSSNLRFESLQDFNVILSASMIDDIEVTWNQLSYNPPTPLIPCALATSVDTPVNPIVSYRPFDHWRGTIGEHVSVQPSGLSLRSDGVKVWR